MLIVADIKSRGDAHLSYIGSSTLLRRRAYVRVVYSKFLKGTRATQFHDSLHGRYLPHYRLAALLPRR